MIVSSAISILKVASWINCVKVRTSPFGLMTGIRCLVFFPETAKWQACFSCCRGHQRLDQQVCCGLTMEQCRCFPMSFKQFFTPALETWTPWATTASSPVKTGRIWHAQIWPMTKNIFYCRWSIKSGWTFLATLITLWHHCGLTFFLSFSFATVLINIHYKRSVMVPCNS